MTVQFSQENLAFPTNQLILGWQNDRNQYIWCDPAICKFHFAIYFLTKNNTACYVRVLKGKSRDPANTLTVLYFLVHFSGKFGRQTIFYAGQSSTQTFTIFYVLPFWVPPLFTGCSGWNIMPFCYFLWKHNFFTFEKPFGS